MLENLMGLLSMPAAVRRAASTPRVNIRELTGDLVRVVGRVALLPGHALTAPLSGRTCAAWFVRVAGVDPTVVEASEAVPFTVVDDSGVARVHPDARSLRLAIDRSDTLGVKRRHLHTVSAFLKTQKGRSALRIDWRLSWEEAALVEGSSVAVLSRASRFTDPSGTPSGYRDQPAIGLLARQTEDDELVVTTFAGALR